MSVACLIGAASLGQAHADGWGTGPSPLPPTTPPPANSITASQLPVPSNAPAYFPPVLQSALSAPLPKLIYDQGGIPAVVPQNELDQDTAGLLGSYQTSGPTITAGNAFFASLGTNGRTCATCHQPPSGMSVSLQNIKARYSATQGNDPIFAPVDGANCPSAVPSGRTAGAVLGGNLGKGSSYYNAHSLLLTKGLFRIFLPVPAGAEYTVTLVSDPPGCNSDPNYNQVTNNGVTTQILSVYRRPRISTNLKFVTTPPQFLPPGTFPPPPAMWDQREPSLESQAIDATLGHAQALQAPNAAQVAQMVAFESAFFSAQSYMNKAGSTSAGGATGGPLNLSNDAAGQLGPGTSAFDEFTSWGSSSNAMMASIARGQNIFNNRQFTISNVNQFNAFFGNPAQGTCTSCHDTNHDGNTFFQTHEDIGTAGDAPQFGGPAPAADLPIFKFTCPAGSTLFNGVPGTVNGQSVVTVTLNDPGRALISGKCADLGGFAVPQLRALAAHAPYFHDGSAATLLDVVNFYNNRFGIGLSAQDKADLVNFLNAL